MKKENKTLIHRPLIIVLIVLAVISCLAIASSAPLITKPNPNGFWTKQLLYYGISAILMLIVYKFGNDRIYSLMWVFYGILMVFLVGLAIENFASGMGKHIIPFTKFVNGATSWYSFAGFQFQPSEFMKIIIIICLAKTISNHNNEYLTHSFRNDCIMIFKVLAISVPPCILIFLQNDTGVMLIIVVAIVSILFSSGIQSRWFIIGGLVLVGALLSFAYIFMYNHDLFSKLLGGGYKLDRFYGWLDPEGTYGKQGYQLFNALLAFGTAGWFGHGFQSTIIAFPEAQTDFIFAVIAQGAGFIGGLSTIICIVFLDAILLRIGLHAKNDTDKYFAAGIFGLLIFQQIWNIAMVLGLVPITGITLPFISYGGSSLLSYMMTMGIFLSMERQARIDSHSLNKYI